MKVILEFNLPEEKAGHTWAIKGYEFWSCLRDLDEELRSMTKYDKAPFKTPYEAIEWVREFIRENVDIDCVD